MASSASPVIVDLSSDSEPVPDDNSSQATEDIFTLDWADDYPISAHDFTHLHKELEEASISSAETVLYTPEITEQIILNGSPPKQVSSQVPSNTDKLSQKKIEKLVKEQNKLERKRLREEKKAEELLQKRLRAAAVQKQRNLKPEENIKLLSINIDTKLVNSEFGGILIMSLQQAGIQYGVGDQIKPFTILWSKKIKDIIVSDDCGVTQEDVGVKEEHQLLYIIDSNEMVKLVNSNELLTHVQTVKSVYPDKHLTLVITGMQRYCHMQKKLRQGVEDVSEKKKRRRNSCDSRFVNVSKDEIQNALIELQIIGNCNHCMIETGEELASLVVSTTKSLSQLDYKREKHQREGGQLDWFAKGDSRQCVKVDKNGAGLMKLWQQQICQFNAVGLEMACAITSNFPSPRNLVSCYSKCSTTTEAQLLLQSLRMRRDAGILSSTRRIGPEISKKLYHFYTSDDPELEL